MISLHSTPMLKLEAIFLNSLTIEGVTPMCLQKVLPYALRALGPELIPVYNQSAHK